jgi:quinol monooxygenase YgiN
VSSHDLRRHFAHRLLVRERLNPRVVMDVGGWRDFQAIEPYLGKPDVETIVDEFEEMLAVERERAKERKRASR